MKAFLKSVVVRLLAVLLTVSAAFAQERVPFRQEELDQMLAPVALYPDALLSQILMASTYPLEVVQAARWSRANPGLTGQDAVRAAEPMDWDPSVKSLTAFPQILTMMDEKLDWTERLGEAFLAQQADVMDSVQALRRRAEAAGNLRSSEQMRVARQGEIIYIQQPAPGIVYVPYYNPVVVYGPWWWPAYPPVYWAAPAYYVVPAHRPVFLWGPGIMISVNFFFGQPDWHRRHVTVVHHYLNRGVAAANVRPAVWQHNPDHRRGMPFRSEAARERFEQIRADTRRDAVRNDAQAVRRLEDTRTADIRQSRLDERRNAVQDRREDRRDSVQVRRDERRDAVQDRRDATANRITPNTDANRATANRDNERVKPAAQPETRQAQPDRSAQPQRPAPQANSEPRNVQPEKGLQPESSAQEDRKARPERNNAPQANDRRGERRDVQRLQARSVDPQPTVVAPVVRSEARSAVAAPIVRAEPRPNPRPAAPAANTHANPRQVFEGGGRAEARNDGDRGRTSRQNMTMRNSAPAPRPSASGGSTPPPIATGNFRGGGGAFRKQSSGTAVR